MQISNNISAARPGRKEDALGMEGYLLAAVWMMMTAVGLLAGLGIYVYPGAQAEAILKRRDK